MDSKETEEVLISMGEGIGSSSRTSAPAAQQLGSRPLSQKVDTEGVRQCAKGRWVFESTGVMISSRPTTL